MTDERYMNRRAAQPRRAFVGEAAPDDAAHEPVRTQDAQDAVPPSAPARPAPLRDQAVPGTETAETGKAMAVYLLHLAGPVTSGLTNLVAVILAYVFRDEADPVNRSHLTNGATIFWGALAFTIVGLGLTIGGAATLLGGVTLFDLEGPMDLAAAASSFAPTFLLMGGGFVLSLFALVWFLVRTIRGIVLLSGHKPYPNPGAWGF